MISKTLYVSYSETKDYATQSDARKMAIFLFFAKHNVVENVLRQKLLFVIRVSYVLIVGSMFFLKSRNEQAGHLMVYNHRRL